MDNCMFWELPPIQLNRMSGTRRKVVAYMTYSGASCGLATNIACGDTLDSIDGHGTQCVRDFISWVFVIIILFSLFGPTSMPAV